MRKFAIQLGWFVSIPVVYLSLNLLINFLIIRDNPPEVGARILITGDSHVNYGIDPAVLGSARNVSQKAEPYYLTFWKLKHLLRYNTIDTVLIGFSYHNISAFNDYKLSDPGTSSEIFERAYLLHDFRSLSSIDIDWPEFYRTFAKRMCLRPRWRHHAFLGDYTNSLISDPTNAKAVGRTHFWRNGEDVGLSTTCIRYLDSIISFTKTRGIELVLVMVPVHHSYEAVVPDNFRVAFNAVRTRVRSLGVRLIEGDKMTLADDRFLDANHLNQRGAEEFTMAIRKQLTGSKHWPVTRWAPAAVRLRSAP